MATKRSAPGVHPSRANQVPNQPSAKRRKPNPHPTGQSFKKSHTVNDLKSSIRSLTRLLSSETADLPANVRVEKERALQSAKHELEETQKDKHKKDMIGRYHKVRFFDRQKATKRLKRFRKALKGAEEAGNEQDMISELKRVVEEAQIEINYAIYYPLDQPYSALFPSKKKNSADDEGAADGEEPETAMGKEQARQGDETMWELVKKCTKNGSLESLRNGKLTSTQKSPEPFPEAAKTRSKHKSDKNAAHAKAEESDGESDGGFFE